MCSIIIVERENESSNLLAIICTKVKPMCVSQDIHEIRGNLSEKIETIDTKSHSVCISLSTWIYSYVD